MTDLEEDFDQVVAKINAKLQEAAEAINEANRLSETVKLPSLIYTQWLGDDIRRTNKYAEPPKSKEEVQAEIDELQEKLEKINVRDLESALGEGGWSTSSSYC